MQSSMLCKLSEGSADGLCTVCSLNHLTEQSSRQAPERTVHELLQPLPAVSALPCLQNAPAAHRQINIALPHKIQIRIQVHRKSRWKCKIVMSAGIGKGQKEQRGGGVTSATFIFIMFICLIHINDVLISKTKTRAY